MENIFGIRLREAREELGLTQDKLAKAMNTQQTHVARWERGARKPSIDTVIAIAKILKVSSDYLLGLENEDGTKNY